jgi:hypothetical protein
VYPAFVTSLFAPLALIPAPGCAAPHWVLGRVVFMAARWFDRGDEYAPMPILVSSTTIIACRWAP